LSDILSALLALTVVIAPLVLAWYLCSRRERLPDSQRTSKDGR